MCVGGGSLETVTPGVDSECITGMWWAGIIC